MTGKSRTRRHSLRMMLVTFDGDEHTFFGGCVICVTQILYIIVRAKIIGYVDPHEVNGFWGKERALGFGF